MIQDGESGQRVLRAMRWGMIPHWSKKQPEFGDIIRAMNARDESLITNLPIFNYSKKSRRCVVIADGFFEWLKDSNPRQPYFVRFQEGKVLTMAGLYDVWKNPETGEELYSYTVITTDPCPTLTFLHDRMPQLLESDEEIDQWLDVSVPFENVKRLLRPYSGKLDIFPVSTFVNKMGHDSEECVKPITKKLEAQKITSWFRKTPGAEEKEKKETKAATTTTAPNNGGEMEKGTEHDGEEIPLVTKKRPAAEASVGEEGPQSQSQSQSQGQEEEKKPAGVKKIKLSDLGKREGPAENASGEERKSQEEPAQEKQPSERMTGDGAEESAKIDAIVALGFSVKNAKAALEKFGGDLEKVCDHLLNNEE